MMNSARLAGHLLWVWFMLHSAILHAGGAETMRVQLGEHRFNIPKQNIREEFPFWLQFIPGLAPDLGSLMFTIAAEEMAKRVAGYQVYDGKFKMDTAGLVLVLGEAELQTYQDPDTHIYSDIWHSRGLYENQVVEWREEFGLYISHRGRNDVFWDLLRIPPRSLDEMPADPLDFWVASCVNGSSPLTDTGRISRCRTTLFYDNLHFQITLYMFNLHLIDGVKSAVLDIFKEWEEQ